MARIKFRFAHEEDLQALGVAEPRQWLQDSAKAVIATRDGGPVGYALVQELADRSWEIVEMVVRDESRRIEVKSALIRNLTGRYPHLFMASEDRAVQDLLKGAGFAQDQTAPTEFHWPP